MADIHDQALDWANANSSDPRAQDIMAKAWASKNPTDPRAGQIMAKFKTADNSMTPGSQNDTSWKSPSVAGTVPGTPGYQPTGLPQLFKGSQAENAAGLQRIASIGNPDATQSDVDKLKYAMGMGMSVAPDIPSETPGVLDRISGKVSTGADRLQQSAMGMKKYSPGAGTEAIEQGVRGTTSTMQEQMKTALDNVGQQSDAGIDQLTGKVSSQPVAERVAGYGGKFATPSGMSTEAGYERVNDANARAAGISARGEMSPQDARQLAQIAEKSEGYSVAGTPKQNYSSQLAQQEAQGYRDQLRQMGSEQNIPVAENFTKLSNLLKGNKALNTPGSPGFSLKKVVAAPIQSYGASALNTGANAIGSDFAGNAAQIALQKLLQKANDQ